MNTRLPWTSPNGSGIRKFSKVHGQRDKGKLSKCKCLSLTETNIYSLPPSRRYCCNNSRNSHGNL